MDFIGAPKASLLSYSMGSLMAFALVEQIPERIDTALFIAPDGLRPNRLLQLGSRNLLINRIFYKLVYSPATVDFILKQLFRFRYIDDPLFRILQGEFKSVETRLTCYNAITYHAQLRFKPDRLVENFNRHRIRSFFYFGKHDKLFPPDIGLSFSNKLNFNRLTVVEAGHELVNPGLNDLLRDHLSKQHNDQG